MTSPEGPKLSKLEFLKEGSHQLRGTIGEELLNDSDQFSGDSQQLLKHHGTYQQDDRDLRKAKNPDGTPKGKSYSCMIRTRVPGGKVTADQFLAELDLCDKYGDGTVRLTTRQGFQLHGVIKGNLREAIKGINETKLTTLAACGDVNRNVMACPAPYKNNSVFDATKRATKPTKPSSSRSKNRSTEKPICPVSSRSVLPCRKTTVSTSSHRISACWESSKTMRLSATTSWLAAEWDVRRLQKRSIRKFRRR